MKQQLQLFFRALAYVIGLHIWCLVALSICRLIVLWANMPQAGVDWSLLPTALLIGIKFDNLIACYMSALPLIVVPVWALATLHRQEYGQWMRGVVKGTSWYYSVVYSILLFVGVADARYYTFFDNHLNIGVTEWFGFVNETAGIVFDDPVNLWFIGIAAVVIAIYITGVLAIGKAYKKSLSV